MNTTWTNKARAGRVAALAVLARRKRLLRRMADDVEFTSQRGQDGPNAPHNGRGQILRLLRTSPS